jgi:hypothetical protein
MGSGERVDLKPVTKLVSSPEEDIPGPGIGGILVVIPGSSRPSRPGGVEGDLASNTIPMRNNNSIVPGSTSIVGSKIKNLKFMQLWIISRKDYI